MTASHWPILTAELDRWQAAGRCLQLWLRDDDAVAPSPALDQLSACAERFRVPVLLAVIPMLAQESLAESLREKPLLLPCQHGCRHQNHAPASAKKSEFGPNRLPVEVDGEIAEARERLRDLLGEAVLPVFVPPWNRIDQGHAARLPRLGFAGLSCFRNHRNGPDGGPRLLNTDLDVMDWHRGRVGRDHADLIAELVGLLSSRREERAGSDTLGLLLHHRDHDQTVWSFLDGLLACAAGHPAVALTDPRDLLRPAGTA